MTTLLPPLRQIRGTHTPSEYYNVDVKPILQLIDEIFRQTLTHQDIDGLLIGGTGKYADTAQDLTTLDELLLGLCSPIQKIYSELSCQCSGGDDLKASTLKLLGTLASYSWEAKVVLTLAAFAVYNGEFRLVAQLRIKNPSVKYVAILKQLSVKPQLEAIDEIIKFIIKVTKCIVEYGEMIQSNYISKDTPPAKI
ncbi:hypothetical protein CerSpe_186960 [Prunus speciosa]